MKIKELSSELVERVRRGMVIPAHPLALSGDRKLDEKRQRALTRYYLQAGAGGLAVGVHTTQFTIRERGLYRPVLELASRTADEHDGSSGTGTFKVAGICGKTAQAVAEAGTALDLGYHAGLVSLAALKQEDDAALVAHCREIAEVLPVVGFYLQPAAGGRLLSYRFWREFACIENVIAIKAAPFNRYQTLDVVRAVAESGNDIALYTGNDDSIVLDLMTPFRIVTASGKAKTVRFVGGLLGHWAVWTKRAVELHAVLRAMADSGLGMSPEMLSKAAAVTDSNSAFFDSANGFTGCIAGIHEVLRRQGLLEGVWTLDPSETLSPGQAAEIDRVYRHYPELNDDAFVRENLERWLQ